MEGGGGNEKYNLKSVSIFKLKALLTNCDTFLQDTKTVSQNDEFGYFNINGKVCHDPPNERYVPIEVIHNAIRFQQKGTSFLQQ